MCLKSVTLSGLSSGFLEVFFAGVILDGVSESNEACRVACDDPDIA